MKFDYTQPVVASARQSCREAVQLARHYYSAGNRRLFSLWLRNARLHLAAAIVFSMRS